MNYRNGLASIVLASALVCASGCSSSGGGNGPRDGASDAPEGGGAGATDAGGDADAAQGGSSGADAAAGGDASGDAPGDAAGDAASPTAYTVKAPTLTIAKGAELTSCVVLDVGNAQTIHVGHIKATLGAPVYEVRVGAVVGTAQATPTPCTAFADIMDASVRPLVYARNDIEDIAFPAGVGYTLTAHQLVKVEIHTWNPTSEDLPANVSLVFTASNDAEFQHEAGLLLVENFNVTLDAGAASVQLGPQFFPLAPTLGAASIFRLEGYTHELGVDLKMSLATSAADAAPTPLYTPASWNPANPLVVDETPAVAVPSPDGGLTLACTWNNGTGNLTVSRGPSVMDERCAAFAWYYPAVAAHLCAHTGSATGPTACL